MFKTIKNWLVGAFATLGLISFNALAEIPATVTGAITSAQDDGETLGYALMVMAIVVGLVFWLKSRAGR